MKREILIKQQFRDLIKKDDLTNEINLVNAMKKIKKNDV